MRAIRSGLTPGGPVTVPSRINHSHGAFRARGCHWLSRCSGCHSTCQCQCFQYRGASLSASVVWALPRYYQTVQGGGAAAYSTLEYHSKGQIKMPRPTLPRYLAKVPCHGGTLKVPPHPPTLAAKVQGMVVGGGPSLRPRVQGGVVRWTFGRYLRRCPFE